ncbi:hypothetical protein ACHWQZ_G018488 [Mnemiopsis leidyi]
MSYFAKNPSRFLKPKSVYLHKVKKLPNPSAKRRYKFEYTNVLNTCNSGAGGVYTPQCKRVTFRIHPTAPDSFHAREYLQNKLSATAEKHSTVSFYVTESQTRVPVVIAHYLNGYQEEQRIDNVHEDVLSQFVEKYCNYSGDIQKRTMNRQQPVDYTRSIQGMWSPYMNTPQPNLNAPLSVQELKNKYRTSVDVDKYRGLPPSYYKDMSKLRR